MHDRVTSPVSLFTSSANLRMENFDSLAKELFQVLESTEDMMNLASRLTTFLEELKKEQTQIVVNMENELTPS